AVWSPPLYPLLMRLAGTVVGGSTLIGGMLVSNLFCLAALWVFYLAAESELPDSAAARRALIYLFIFPPAFFFFPPYTEPIYFLGAAMCLYALRNKQWVASGLWGALAAASRLPAVLIIIPAAWAAWREWSTNHDRRVWIAPLLIATGGSLF